MFLIVRTLLSIMLLCGSVVLQMTTCNKGQPNALAEPILLELRNYIIDGHVSKPLNQFSAILSLWLEL